MDLVDDQDVIGRKPGITRNFLQQNSVGHHLQTGIRRTLPVEPGLKSNPRTKRYRLLLGDAPGDRPCRNAPGLGHADARVGPEFKAELR